MNSVTKRCFLLLITLTVILSPSIRLDFLAHQLANCLCQLYAPAMFSCGFGFVMLT